MWLLNCKEKGTEAQEEQTRHEGSKTLNPRGGGQLGQGQTERKIKAESRGWREQGRDAERSQGNEIPQEEVARKSQQPREGESPVPAAGGPWHLAVPMQAAPPPPVTAGLLSPSLPPCSPTPERSHGQWGLSLVQLPVPGVAGTETPPELPAPRTQRSLLRPFLTSQLPPLRVCYFFTLMQLTQIILIRC